MGDSSEFFMKDSTCKVCGRTFFNKHYKVQEMMYGTKEEFDYFVCEECGCIQIAETPKDLGKYYSDNYYSFAERKEFSGRRPEYTYQKCLDVGCGSGKWLLAKAEAGYGNLWGCDPFIEADISYGDSVHIKKCDIAEMEGEYDIIRFSDSFEHMDNPAEVMGHIARLLKADGEAIIKMPIFPNAAFDTFGAYWYQLDAPRHLIIHSTKSLEYLCKQAGLRVDRVDYDSLWGQFAISYLYQVGVPLKHQNDEVINIYFTSEEQQFFRKMTEKANDKGCGDHATFYVRHL